MTDAKESTRSEKDSTEVVTILGLINQVNCVIQVYLNKCDAITKRFPIKCLELGMCPKLKSDFINYV